MPWRWITTSSSVASADGYAVAFGDVGDVRLMETLAMAERSAVVVTVVRYELSKALTPIVRDRYPNLIRFIAVDDDEDRARFEALGMRAVINRSTPRGLDLAAAAVLRAQSLEEDRIRAWMQRQQERALAAAVPLGRPPWRHEKRRTLPSRAGAARSRPTGAPEYDKPLPAAWFT